MRRLESILAFAKNFPGAYLDGNIAEIADYSVATIGKRDATYLPFIELACSSVKALGDPLGREVLFSGFESVAESLHDFVSAGH